LNFCGLNQKLFVWHLPRNRIDQFIATLGQIEDLAEQIEETVTDLLTYYEYYLLAKNPKKSLYDELEALFKTKESNEIAYDFKNSLMHMLKYIVLNLN